MGTRNYLWHFILPALLCTIMALEGREAMTAPAESHVNVSRSTNNDNNGTGPAAPGSNGAELKTTHSPLGTTSLSPSTMVMLGGEGTTGTAPTAMMWERSSSGMSAKGTAASPAFPTRGAGSTAAPSTGMESGTASSLPLRSATTSHSSSSSSSSVGSSAVTPSPEHSSSSSPPGTPLGTTSQPPTAPVFSSPSSPAGATAGPAQAMTQGPASPRPAASTPGTGEAGLPPALGSSAETSPAQLSPTALPQEGTATPSPTGSPSPPVRAASAGGRATAPPGEGQSPAMGRGSRTTGAESSHSFPSTSLPTPSPTSLSTSTSVNPSATGTCTPITLSIQLQNVTSTMIQFSWQPQGGTADSPYTVRLLRKSRKMQERVLNETSIAFEGLLPGCQYQISVEVSTCSKNVSTSLTVQTAAEVFNGTTKITSEEFKPEYKNKSSVEFKEFEKKFIMEITKHLQELQNGTKIRIVINSIEKGSVVVHLDIVLDVGQNITIPEISDAFIEALNRSTLFKFDLRNISIEARNSCKPGFNDCHQNATCTTEGTTYSCECNKGFTDKSPRVPGRICQQDPLSPPATPVPPNTNTTSTNGTASTTPVPANTNTTSTNGTASTTPVPANTNTTSTNGTSSTTPVPANTNTTSTNGTSSTTPVPANTNTTSTNGTSSTTPVPANTNTTSTNGTSSTTPVPANTNTTSTNGTSSTTPVPANTNTTSTNGTSSTTPVPANTNTTSTNGTSSTTPVPANTNTTSTNGTASTTPVPPNTNTTGLTGSTSNSIFNTTFTSAPCMTVSIEVQNVTREEIHLSWTSSSKGSLYNISIMDGKEINTTTTNKTKTVFKNLLPGHLYTISVAASSCAENQKTSVAVRTDPDSCFKRTEFCSAQSTGCSDLKGIVCSNNHAFACKVWLNETFNNALYNSHSEDYIAMSKRIKTDVVGAMNAELGNDHSDIVVLGFRPGSVITDFLFLLPKEDAVDVDDIQAQLNRVLRSKFGSNTEVQSLSVQSSTDNSSSWRVAVIVLGVLLGVALVLILLAILFYIYMRRRSGMEFSTLYTW
uniref:Uromodulin like 1 n=1 Tax=Ficedula albicollis TaxID=59894 RepID=A0A803W4C3_FICAL